MANIPESSWNDISEPGAYINLTTGNLFRVPRAALGTNGIGILIKKHTLSADRIVQISADHAISLYEARVICIKNNLRPNF